MSHRILVADDDAEQRQRAGAALAAEGYEVIEVATGRRLLELINSTPHCELVVADIGMPLGPVRDASTAPIIVTSSCLGAELHDKVDSFGADAVLLKPLDTKRLVEVARNLVPPIVLLAEDDSDFRSLLVASLEGEGFAVVAAGSGLDVLELVEDPLRDKTPLPFDAIVADDRMPFLRGLEILAGVRAAGFQTPFFLVTSFPEPSLVDQARKLGVDLVIRKPFPIGELTSALRARLAQPTAPR